MFSGLCWLFVRHVFVIQLSKPEICDRMAFHDRVSKQSKEESKRNKTKTTKRAAGAQPQDCLGRWLTQIQKQTSKT